ncbi:hypothetical protein GOBAR_AA14362 [Gossypium barbadense]|uniref:DUF632 domain-containing protein n=1 Tax=Gossypium barbadense TaxID=3634 RepID=A0A2P5XSG4_GOSBA|nr:hypothetical protein GOBAR_AA14362 [Gossypium barbadense]
MGCVASKLEEEEEVVSICRERKRLIKLAVDRRYALAEAHFRYCQALYAVSAAIKLFVARHSSPPSPFLITFPPPCPPTPPATDQNVIANPMLLQQRPSESTHEAIACESCGSSTSSDISDEETESEVIISGYNRCSDDDLRAVREQEGIPELEEEGDTKEEEKKVVLVEEKDTKREQEESESGLLKVKEETHVSQGEQKGLTVIDSPEKGRELLEALKDIEDYFVRAYDSGKDVSRMLEANMVHLQSGLEGIKENSTKLIQAITWHRSTLSKPQSCKSLVASSSKSSSAWTEYKNDLFDQYAGMDSGSHSLTLERLYAWEKKLYEEVKAGDSTRKIYERKCSRLRNQDVKGYDELTMDKTRAAVKDLYARILIAIRSAETISKRIQNLRDEELLPQIIELLKFLVPEVEFYSRGRSSGAPYGANGPPLLVICYNWLTSMDELPDKAVTFSLKSFSKDVKALWAQQGEEQQQKRKVDGMAKELDRRTMAFQKAETRFLESKLTEYKSEMETEQQNEYLTEKKDQLEMIRKRLDVEREKHHNHMQETQRITLNGLQTGFSTVFESLIEFSKASMKIYNDIVTLSEKMGKVSYIEGSSQVEENSSR